MKRLPIYIVLLQSLLFVGIKPVNAGVTSVPPQRQQAETEVAENPLLKLPSGVWVLKDNNAQRQPFVWVVDNVTPQQPLLQLIKDENKPNLANSTPKNSTENKTSDLQPFYEVVKNTDKVDGLYTLYTQKDTGKIYLEIKPQQLNQSFLGTITMESGIGERGIYSGMPLQDFLFYFRRVNNNLHFVVRNVNFRTHAGDPQARSLARSFSDSVLYTLPIKSIHPQRQTILVDLGDLLLSDVPGLSAQLTSILSVPYQLDSKKSYFGEAKAFPLNVEIESVYGFSSSGNRQPNLSTVPDSRALTLRVRYSFSELPKDHNYRPRLADERVGYFITAYQDFSSDDRSDPFVRYINRWNLEKQDPKAALSPPKKPIVFWIENAVPLEYREAIAEGVLMWNKAFEKAGFKDAIQVRQMPNDAKWDPADVRYNTIRWINTVDGFFALGPSRVNPLNGEILDADILVDASFVRRLKHEYRNLIQQNQTQPTTSLLSHMMGASSNLCTNELRNPAENELSLSSAVGIPHPVSAQSPLSRMAIEYDLCYGMEALNQFTLGSLALSLFQDAPPNSNQMKEYIHQYLRLVIAHEVGHTLGLRHNFRGSNLLQPEELNNTKITQIRGLTTSVMDYIPPNLAPQGLRQGDYFPSVVGSYDIWAIEYGYTPFVTAHPTAEKQFLNDIARRSAQPELAYATDEDLYDLDPEVNAWDNSGDVLRYSQWQLENSRVMWDRLHKRYPIQGESYAKLSELFDSIFLHYLRHTYYTTKFIGGQSFSRSYAGDRSDRLPFEPIPVEKQRQALATLQRYIFAENAFNFSPELLNKLAPSRWRHWGSDVMLGRLDYPIHDSINLMQSLVLKELLSGDRLVRLRDIELKSKPGSALTLPELFDTLQKDIWTEVVEPDSSTQISSLRRALQREHLKLLIAMVLRNSSVPEDARTLAWYKLRQLRDRLDRTISRSDHFDEYTKAHLEETRDRIEKTLNAQMQSR